MTTRGIAICEQSEEVAQQQHLDVLRVVRQFGLGRKLDLLSK